MTESESNLPDLIDALWRAGQRRPPGSTDMPETRPERTPPAPPDAEARLRDLARLVERMRLKQREYFRGRSAAVLNECRDLERRVDAAVAAVLRPEPPGLFDGGGQAP